MAYVCWRALLIVNCWFLYLREGKLEVKCFANDVKFFLHTSVLLSSFHLFNLSVIIILFLMS